MSRRACPAGFEPLAMAPSRAAARYEKPASLAQQQPRAAIKLKCLDCCGWEYSEAKRWEIRTCPLWALNRRIFARGQGVDG